MAAGYLKIFVLFVHILVHVRALQPTRKRIVKIMFKKYPINLPVHDYKCHKSQIPVRHIRITLTTTARVVNRRRRYVYIWLIA